jgi:asparagine synthase (glutamine-hydrolysing)
MASTIVHRGPDDSGSYFSPDGVAALGFRRLSIIDLSTGHQPLSNEDGSIWIVFNGEIYDFQDTRKRLLEAGHRFSTKTDTEVIVHLYEERGADCVQDLRGMFSFAIWDEQRKCLFAARDRVGKKPFFYCMAGEHLFFASELKSLLAVLDREPQIDPQSLDQYLAFGYVPAPRTIYRDVCKLPPGHCLRFSSSGLEVRQYWKLSYRPEIVASEAELIQDVEKLLREAVRLRLISDVPLGALLSGGVDSSIVVALMAQEGGHPPKTFSVGFDESEYSELVHARRVARYIGTEHYEQIVRPDVIELLTELVDHYDEPFADSSMIPTFLVCRHARQHVTVALSGDGGDEVFGGYPRYLYQLWISRLLRLPGTRLAAQALYRVWPDQWRGKRQLKKMKYLEGRRYAEQVSLLDSETRRGLRKQPLRDGIPDGGEEYIREHYLPTEERRSWEPLSRLQYLDTVVGYLPGDILTKVDMASMRVSLEVRSPLLDQQVIEFMSRVPARFKIRGTCTKYLLKKIGERHVPAEVLYRPKRGFTLPLKTWFRQDLRGYVESMLLGEDSRVARLFDRAALQKLVHDHVVRGLDCTEMLFCILCLEIWFRRKRVFSLEDIAGLGVEPAAAVSAGPG